MSSRRLVSLLSVLGVGAAASLGACAATVSPSGSGSGHGSSDTGSQVSAVNVTADVDPKTGSIVLPIDRFFLSESELADIESAHGLAMGSCTAAHGYNYGSTKVIPEIGGQRNYGVWVMTNAEQFGYEVPASPAKQAALQRNSDPSQAPTDAQLSIIKACAHTPDAQALEETSVRASSLFGDATTGLGDKALASAKARQVIGQWAACLTAKGLQRNLSGGPFNIKGVTEGITESNIRIAVQDVQCKDQVDLVRRMATIDASFQAPVVKKYAAELTELRVCYDKLVSRARTYLTAHAPVD